MKQILMIVGLGWWIVDGASLTIVRRDNGLACLTAELCLLPFHTNHMLEYILAIIATIGELMFWIGLIISNIGKDRPVRSYRCEANLKLDLGIFLLLPWIFAGLLLLGVFGEELAIGFIAIVLFIGFAFETLVGAVLLIQSICIRKRIRNMRPEK